MNSFAINNSFISLNDQELYSLNGGEFWTGLGLIGAAIVVGATAIACAPAAITVGAACAVGAGFFGAQFSFVIGLTEMLGGDL